MKLFSIFNSIDGEVNKWGQGHFSTFIRLAGCNLRCSYCDTPYALFSNCGKETTIENIISRVREIGCSKITITGGEPFTQEDTTQLICQLLRHGYSISIETNGSIVPVSYNGVNIIMDYKLPSSKMEEHMIWEAFYRLKSDDIVKFVVADELDYNRMIQVMYDLRKNMCVADFAVSPMEKTYPAPKLIEQLKKDKIFEIIVNLQLHKLINLTEDK